MEEDGDADESSEKGERERIGVNETDDEGDRCCSAEARDGERDLGVLHHPVRAN